ncbi:retrotransposon hot spot (RHS) protein [Trypanosoma cruzi]|nr:retrotransposon hot spot (RHS) protein [Trypanosoma cruzi]
MPGGQNGLQGGNAESLVSAVPQGDGLGRARQGFESETDEPAATRGREEERQRPQWTISSTVKEILLEGNTGMAKMWLSEFLRSNLDEEWVVDTNENVTMQEFVLRIPRVISAMREYWAKYRHQIIT